jgi:hypothetical protein
VDPILQMAMVISPLMRIGDKLTFGETIMREQNKRRFFHIPGGQFWPTTHYEVTTPRVQ